MDQEDGEAWVPGVYCAGGMLTLSHEQQEQPVRTRVVGMVSRVDLEQAEERPRSLRPARGSEYGLCYPD